MAYAIGVSTPVSVMVDSFKTGVCSDRVLEQAVERVFDLRPEAIINRFKLRRPIYRQFAAYGHFGRNSKDALWEKIDQVRQLKSAVREIDR